MKLLTYSLFILVLTACQNNANKPTQSYPLQAVDIPEGNNDNKSFTTIPENVLDYVAIHFEGWVIPDTSNYIKAWWSFYDINTIPYIVATDINDDNLTDYGLILKNEDSVKNIILIGTSESFVHWIDPSFSKSFNSAGIEHGLTVIPPGRIDIVYPREASLILKSNGIALNHYETPKQIVYWADGKIQVFNLN